MKSYLTTLLCFVDVLYFGVDLHACQPSKPNVVIIFIDDLGYGDVGFNGATVARTPNIDRMASEGMQFTDFYVGCAVCSGSRASLMTGCHYQRLSVRRVLFPHSQKGLHPDEVTLADMLKDAGYRTACIGKWHLGHLPPCLPTDQGFEQYWGIPYSNDMWIDPANKLADNILLRNGITLSDLKAGHKVRNEVPVFRNDEVIEYPADQATLTRRYTERSVQFIKEHAGQPFFLYLPHTMVHVPLAVSEEFNNPEKDLITNAIEEVDWSVGQILSALRESGLADNTLVIFTSDNGAAVGSSMPLRGKKRSVYDGGIREPTVMWWPGRIPEGSICREITATIDVMPTLVELCGGRLPPRRIDGKNIWPLMSGRPGAASPHEYYVLTYGPGTVRSGRWKYYPWQEGTVDTFRDKPLPTPSAYPVQLYDLQRDIGETQNVAESNPDVVRRLQSAYAKHAAEITANARQAAVMIRPPGAPSPGRPGKSKSRQQ